MRCNWIQRSVIPNGSLARRPEATNKDDKEAVKKTENTSSASQNLSFGVTTLRTILKYSKDAYDRATKKESDEMKSNWIHQSVIPNGSLARWVTTNKEEVETTENPSSSSPALLKQIHEPVDTKQKEAKSTVRNRDPSPCPCPVHYSSEFPKGLTKRRRANKKREMSKKEASSSGDPNRLQQLMKEPSLIRDPNKDKITSMGIIKETKNIQTSTGEINRTKKVASTCENGVTPAPRGPDLVCAIDDEVCCGEGEHYECERHSHSCVDGMPPDAPCDCCKSKDTKRCRHGHTLSSLIRTDDCKSCNRNVSGCHVSPKYPQMRQRMLKALNQRRDEEADNSSNTKSTVKKEVITINRTPTTEDVDALVRMIEGTGIAADPKKAAKRARQKEKKLQIKIDEERKREEEEKRKLEEEERIRKEKEQQEEEEKLKAEELKKLSRRTKKKNRKKRNAAKNAEANSVGISSGSSDAVAGQSLQTPIVTCNKVSKDQNPGTRINLCGNSIPSGTALDGPNQNPVLASTEKTSDMVTIRRHPSQPESVVTISLKGKHGGEDLLYYLINGQIFKNDQTSPKASPNNCKDEGETPKLNKKKKKNKTKTSSDNSTEKTVPVLPNGNGETKEFHKFPRDYTYANADGRDDIDLSKLKLPPGITITKVNSLIDQGRRRTTVDSISCNNILSSVKASHTLGSGSNNCNRAFDSNSGVLNCDTNMIHQCMREEDYFIPTENEEFEEVISSKTRRKRIKAAKSKEFDGPPDDSESVRSSPSSGISTTYYSRRTGSSCDKAIENGLNKRSNVAKSAQQNKQGKSSHSNGTSKYLSGLEKGIPTCPRRDQYHRGGDVYGGPMTMGANVMPRIARAHAKIVENMVSFANEPQSSSASGSRSTCSFERNENSKYIPDSPTRYKQINNNTDHPNQLPNEVSQPVMELSEKGHSMSQLGLKLWDHVDSSSSRGKFVRQTDAKGESWSPWKDYSWTEGSTPENPSPRFGIDSTPVSQCTFPFQELSSLKSGKSPIQRPVPTTPEIYETAMSANQDFSPKLSNAYDYSTSSYFGQTQTRSHPNPEDMSFKRSFDLTLNGTPQNLKLSGSDTRYDCADELSGINRLQLSDRTPPNNLYNLNIMNETAGFGRNDNVYEPRQLDHSFGTLPSCTPDFTSIPARPSSTYSNNRQWNAFTGTTSSQLEQEMQYGQTHLNTSTSIPPPPSPQSQTHWPMNDAIAIVNEQRRLGRSEQLPYSVGQPNNSESYKEADHPNAQVSPRLPEMSSSARMHWNSGATQFIHDFTNGAHQ